MRLWRSRRELIVVAASVALAYLWLRQPPPLWSHELQWPHKQTFVGWLDDDRLAIARQRADKSWEIATLASDTGRDLERYKLPLPFSLNGSLLRTSGDGTIGLVDYENWPRLEQQIDLATGQVTQHPVEERSASGQWTTRLMKQNDAVVFQLRSGAGDFAEWPSDEQRESWGLTPPKEWHDPEYRLTISLRGLKFSQDETQIATIWERREESITQPGHGRRGTWEAKLHEWPSGRVLHQWDLGQPDQGFAFLDDRWENNTFLLEETYDLSGFTTLAGWHRCQVTETGVEMAAIPWAEFGERSYKSGYCLERFYEKRSVLPLVDRLLSVTWLPAPISRWLNWLPKTSAPQLRDVETGQIVWKGPDGFADDEWAISPNRQTIAGPSSRWTEMAVFRISRPRRWLWTLGLLLLTAGLWRWWGQPTKRNDNSSLAAIAPEPAIPAAQPEESPLRVERADDGVQPQPL